jgi:hemolysin activation/secretion protein
MHRICKHPIAAALALALLSTGLSAQTTPDAGALRQQIEQGREANLPRQALPTKPATPEAMRPLSGVVITVKQFHLVGNTLLGTEQLQPVLASYLNRALDYSQLQAAAAAVADVYRAAGWVVRAYLPQQDIKDGVVTIQIVEAVFGGVKLEGTAAKRVGLLQIQHVFDAQQPVGTTLNANALDRALLLADDLPGVAVSGSLREGSQSGQTDLVLKLADEPLTVGEVSLDNTGARSTGADRLSANLNLNSPFQRGDLLSANAIHTEGSDYLRLGGTLPVGAKGWRIGANASTMNYRLVGADFAALEAKGSSSTAGLEVSYPLIRSRLKNLYFNANADFKSFDNQANEVTTTHYQANALTLAINGNLFDKLGGGGANAASLTFTRGQLDLGGSPNQAADAASTQTDGSFNKLRYSASRQQVITDDVSFFAALSGQWASKNLDSSEKFYLGGASGVRAYPSSEAGGASGQLVNLELRYRLPQGLNLTAFYDAGQVSINANNNYASAPALNDISLKGAGLTLAWQGTSGLSLKGTWARRIGDNPNPNPTTAGNDQDGSLVRNRVWVTASMPF